MPLPEPPPYRIPACLRDLVLVDLLELTGSTTAAACLLSVSQPSVSRRYRALADELGLERQRSNPIGRRFADQHWMLWLRRGVNDHRLASGVIRLAAATDYPPAFCKQTWVEWLNLPKRTLNHWPDLLRLELLDAVVIEADETMASLHEDFDCLPLQTTRQHPLSLVYRRDGQVTRILTSRLLVRQNG